MKSIIRQIKTLDTMPLTQTKRQNVKAAFQLVIDGLASQLFGSAAERELSALQESDQPYQIGDEVEIARPYEAGFVWVRAKIVFDQGPNPEYARHGRYEVEFLDQDLDRLRAHVPANRIRPAQS